MNSESIGGRTLLMEVALASSEVMPWEDTVKVRGCTTVSVVCMYLSKETHFGLLQTAWLTQVAHFNCYFNPYDTEPDNLM
jgi:hypothetical protein